MARVTVEDCLDNLENRFELVLVAAKRARQIATGGQEPRVSEDGDKPTVLALREIADGKIGREEIETLERGPESDDIADLTALIQELDLNAIVMPEDDEDDDFEDVE